MDGVLLFLYRHKRQIHVLSEHEHTDYTVSSHSVREGIKQKC